MPVDIVSHTLELAGGFTDVALYPLIESPGSRGLGKFLAGRVEDQVARCIAQHPNHNGDEPAPCYVSGPATKLKAANRVAEHEVEESGERLHSLHYTTSA